MPLDIDPAAAVELGEAIVLPLADDEIDFDEAFVVDDVEGGLAEDGSSRGILAEIEFLAEDGGQDFQILEEERDDDIDVPRHAGLGVVVERHGAGQHVVQTRLLKTPGDVEEELEFGEHEGGSRGLWKGRGWKPLLLIGRPRIHRRSCGLVGSRPFSPRRCRFLLPLQLRFGWP